MTFGNQTDEATAFRILDKAFDAGVNFFDTAENYPVPPDEKWAGRTEEIIGCWVKSKRREVIIMATKVCGPSHGWIKGAQRAGMAALDRHNIVRAIDASLTRLNTDYVDLYQTHWPDHAARYEEAERTRRSGLSRQNSRDRLQQRDHMGAHEELCNIRREGLVRYETIHNNFSLNNRRFEDELMQACRKEDVSLIPFSPLGGGVLSGKYNGGRLPDGARFSNYLKMGGRQATMARRFVNEKTLASTERFAAEPECR